MSDIAKNPALVGSESRLLWVDCEFTGLPLEQGHKIIEIGAAVTSLALTEIDTYDTFVNYDWAFIEKRMDSNPWWDNRNEDRLRMQAGTASGKHVSDVDLDLASFVREHFFTTKPPVCGNSVGNDKLHIEAQLPAFASTLDYRIIDISSLKLVVQKYLGSSYDGKLHRHHALDDIRESIDEFRFLLKKLGIADVTQLL